MAEDHEEIHRALGRLEGTLDQVEKNQARMTKDLKTIRKDITRLKVKAYSINALISAVSGGLSGFLAQITKP